MERWGINKLMGVQNCCSLIELICREGGKEGTVSLWEEGRACWEGDRELCPGGEGGGMDGLDGFPFFLSM